MCTYSFCRTYIIIDESKCLGGGKISYKEFETLFVFRGEQVYIVCAFIFAELRPEANARVGLNVTFWA